MDKENILTKIKTMKSLQAEIMTEVAAEINSRHQFKLGGTLGSVSVSQVYEVMEGESPNSHPIYQEILTELMRLKIPIKNKHQVHARN